MIEGWIIDENLWPFVETASSFVGVKPDEYDREAIEHGLTATDFEADRWFSYAFGPDSALRLTFARDIGTSVLFVKAEATVDVNIRLEVLMEVLSNYQVI